MRKTDKKLDHQICKTLTDVCENTMKAFEGFEWLTHIVDYSRFPQSLKIILVFETNEHLIGIDEKLDASTKATIKSTIQLALSKINIAIKQSQITFDSEENCSLKHDGNWRLRLGGSSF